VGKLNSVERLFVIATSKLNDKHSEDEREKFISQNDKVKTLINLINEGRKKIYDEKFLETLWSSIINKEVEKSQNAGSVLKEKCGLSLYKIPGQDRNLPILIANIDSSDPEYQLNSIIKVNLKKSEYKIYSTNNKNDAIDFIPTENKPLLLRKPYSRFLARYKGERPLVNREPDNGGPYGFPDDYVGYNASLKEMNFDSEGQVIFPILCTPELYGNILDSSDSMINELYLQSLHDGYSDSVSPENKLRFLKWRNSLHKKVDDPINMLTHVQGRAAGFGLAALTVINIEGKYEAIRAKRSKIVGTFQGAYHVIPAGMANLDPSSDKENPYIEKGYLNIRYLIEKEFVEEWFSFEEAGYINANIGQQRTIIENAVKRYLYGENNCYDAKVFLTGIVFDLLNYRPEICILILINEKKWWEDHNPFGKDPTKLNYEINDPHEGGIRQFNIAENELLTAMEPGKCCLSGIASFYLGVQMARKILNIEVKD